MNGQYGGTKPVAFRSFISIGHIYNTKPSAQQPQLQVISPDINNNNDNDSNKVNCCYTSTNPAVSLITMETS